MSKICIFELKKECDNCGECLICDLDRSKTCDDCGKCLEMEGLDMKEIQIDEVIEDANDLVDELEIENIEDVPMLEEQKEDWELIDDFKGLDEIIEKVRVGDKPEETGYCEEYPGLIIKRKSSKPEIKKYLN